MEKIYIMATSVAMWLMEAHIFDERNRWRLTSFHSQRSHGFRGEEGRDSSENESWLVPICLEPSVREGNIGTV